MIVAHMMEKTVSMLFIFVLIALLNSTRWAVAVREKTLSSSSKVVVCYHGAWSIYRPGDGQFGPSNINPNLCTHAIYSFAKLNDVTWEIESSDPYLDLPSSEPGGGNDGYGDFVALKYINRELKVTLAIGGWNEGSEKYSDMAADPNKRLIFVTSAVEFVRKYNFDGLDLDWEYPTERGGIPEDKENFVSLVKELKEEFQKYDLLLTSAIGVGSEILSKAYDFPALCEELDFFHLMMYDLYGNWDSFTGHHTSMFKHPNLDEDGYSLTQALDIIESNGGCLSKMVLGMGMYAQTYTLADPSKTNIGDATTGPGAAGPYTKQLGMLGFNEICILSGYDEGRDNYTMAPWKFRNDQWFAYDDVESIEYKSLFAIEKNMAGGMIWSIETDDFKGKCNQGVFPLLSKIYEVMSTAHQTTSALASESTTKLTSTPNPTTSDPSTNPTGSSPTTSSESVTSPLSTTESSTRASTLSSSERPTTSKPVTTADSRTTTTFTSNTTQNSTDDDNSMIYIYILLAFTLGVISIIFLIFLCKRCCPSAKPKIVVNNNIFNT